MTKTIDNVLTGVGVLSVRDENALAEWVTAQQMNGLYSAHLTKSGAGNAGSTHVQFNPTTHTVTFQDFVDDMDAPGTGFQFWERTSGGVLNWSQFELRFEEVGGDGWFEVTCIPHQHQAYNANDWGALAYIVIDATPCGFGGNTPDGSSVFAWGGTTVDIEDATDAVGVDGSVAFAFEAAEVASGAGVFTYVLARVRVELWENQEREVWIGDVDIDGHEYTIEPGGPTPGLVLSGPNVEIGYTEDGVTVTYTADEASIEVEEETFEIDSVITKETAEITCNMAESSLFNIDKAMAGSVLSGNVITLGGGVNKKLNLTLEVVTPSGFKRTYYIPKAVATGAVGTPYKKGEKALFPVTFKALKGDEYAVLMVDCAA